MAIRYIILLLLSYFWVTNFVYAQAIGLPFIQTFSSKDHDAHTQNWCVVQDKRGLMYFGNQSGVLEFDGTNWNLIELPTRTPVFALAIDPKGRIFVGGNNELGYLKANKNGTLEYVSMLQMIPKEYQDFTAIQKIYVTETQLIVQSPKFIFTFNLEEIWANKQNIAKIIAPDTYFHLSFYVKDKFYTLEWGRGLLSLVNDRLQLIPNGDQLAFDHIYSILPYDNDQILLASRERGLLLYSVREQSLKVWDVPINDFIKKNQLLCGAKVSEDEYAFGTLQSGIIFIDKFGKPMQHLAKNKGLSDDPVYYIFQGYSRNLWLLLGQNISHVEYAKPFTKFDDQNGLLGKVKQILVHENMVYVATSRGVFCKVWTENSSLQYLQANSFSLVEGTQGNTYWLKKYQGRILAGGEEGMFELREKNAINVSRVRLITNFLEIPNSKKALLGTINGLFMASEVNGMWEQEYPLKGLDGSSITLTQNKNGDIWLCKLNEGVFKLTIKNEKINIKFYDQNNGLPSATNNQAFIIGGELVFGTEKGVYFFDEEEEHFEKYPIYNELLGGEYYIKLLKEDSSTNIWFVLGHISHENYEFNLQAGVLKSISESKKLIPDKERFYKLKGSFIEDITILDTNRVLFGGDAGIIFYDEQKNNLSKPISFFSLIRKVEEDGSGQDSVFFGGTFIQQDQAVIGDQPQIAVQSFPYSLNSLRISFSAPYYESLAQMQYQYFLEGYDHSWSLWTQNTQKEYTNLPEGNYTFKVKARNIYQIESKISVYQFTILAPWYRTFWAYLFYIILIISALYGVLWLNTYRLRQEQQRLENMVEQRTEEVRTQANEILTQNQLLQQADLQIKERNEELNTLNLNLEGKVRERTFELHKIFKEVSQAHEELDSLIYHSSHELRGPIRRVLGVNYLLKLSCQDQTLFEYIDLIDFESKEMDSMLSKLQLVNKINTTSSNYAEIDFCELLEHVLENFQNQLNENRILFNIDVEKSKLIFAAPELLKIILENLIENAICFSAEDSRQKMIEIKLKRKGKFTEILMKDNGIGIPHKSFEEIFTMFFRGSGRSKGNGIGLYLVKKALDKIGGRISVDSMIDKFTIFSVLIPISSQGFEQKIQKITEQTENEILQKNA